MTESTIKFMENCSNTLKPLISSVEDLSKKRYTGVKKSFNPPKEEKVISMKVEEVKENSIYPTLSQSSEFEKSEWYYLDSKTSQQGPYTWKQMRELYSKKEITNATYIYGGNLESWTQIHTNPLVLGSLSMDL